MEKKEIIYLTPQEIIEFSGSMTFGVGEFLIADLMRRL
jgi:hypothetical protein